jgi:hypothetical protein
MHALPMTPSGAVDIPVSGYDRAAGLAGNADALLLDRWAANVSVRAIDAAIALLRLHLPSALLTRIEILAGIGWHRLGIPLPLAQVGAT